MHLPPVSDRILGCHRRSPSGCHRSRYPETCAAIHLTSTAHPGATGRGTPRPVPLSVGSALADGIVAPTSYRGCHRSRYPETCAAVHLTSAAHPGVLQVAVLRDLCFRPL